MREEAEKYNVAFRDKTPEETLEFFLRKYDGRIALSSSLAAEDQVLTDMVLKIKNDARIFTLDTGRLHQETYNAMQATSEKYGMKYEVYFPDADEVEEMIRNHGPNLFYASVENRRRCCHVRKVGPLKRALKTLDVWITGMRASQSVTRADISKIEYDENNKVIKLNPIFDWSAEDVWKYINKNHVPYNELHDKGYPSIGCAPCTRAVEKGEDVRAGRWWWESPEQKECGLHCKDARNKETKND